MAISRYDSPANLNIIDTYVPLPFKEIKATIDEKQKMYDDTESTFETSPSILSKLNVHEFWKDSNNQAVGRNIGYDIIEAKKKQIQETQQALYDKYKGDWSNPDAQKEVRAFANNLSYWYNNVGEKLQKKSQAYQAEQKKAAEQKLEYGNQDVHYNYDNMVHNEAKKSATNTEDLQFDSPSYFVSQNKADIVNGAAKDLGQTLTKQSGNVNLDFNTMTTQQRSQLLASNKSQVQSALNSVLSNLNTKHNQEVVQIARKEASKYGVSPEELLNHEITYKDSNGKQVKTTWKEIEKQKLDNEIKNQFYAKLNTRNESDLDFKNMSNAQLGLGGLGEDGQPLELERSTQVGGEVTNLQPIDFNNVKDNSSLDDKYNQVLLSPKTANLNLPFNESKKGKVIDGKSANYKFGTPEFTLEQAKSKLKNSTNTEDKKLLEKDISSLEGFIKEKEAFNKLKEKAKTGDLVATHEFFYKTNPVYKNTTYAYAEQNGKLGKNLSKEDIQNIQAITNRNLQTIQSNQEVSLNPTYDKEAITNVVNSIYNGNAIIRDSKGVVIPQKDFDEILNDVLPENKRNSTGKKQELENAVTNYITPVGSKEAGYKMTLNGENYHVTYPNSQAVPELRKYQELTSNIYNPTASSRVEVQEVPEEVNNLISTGIQKYLSESDILGVTYSSIRNDYNINDSYIEAKVKYEKDGKISEQSFQIPVFPRKTRDGKQTTNISSLSTTVNPQTGLTQDMMKYTPKDAESLKYLEPQEE